MTSKWVAFLFSAIALSGCCASGTGCYAPVAGTPVAWDGLGPSPDEESPGGRGSSRGDRGPAQEAGETGRQASRWRHGRIKRQTAFGSVVGAERGGRSRRRKGVDEKTGNLPRLFVVDQGGWGNRQRTALKVASGALPRFICRAPSPKTARLRQREKAARPSSQLRSQKRSCHRPHPPVPPASNRRRWR